MAYQRDPEGRHIRTLQDYVNLTHVRVLEIGCGKGFLLWQYANSTAQAIGIDLNHEAQQLIMNTDDTAQVSVRRTLLIGRYRKGGIAL